MNQDLENYITQSRAAGMDDAAIRQALLDSGWTTEQFEASLSPAVLPPPVAVSSPEAVSATTTPITEPVEAVEKPTKRRRWGLIIGVIVLLIIILAGAVTALAEKGYFPAISKFYRKTNLPLVWHGTNSNAALALAQAISSSLSTKPVELTTDVTYDAVVDTSFTSSLSAFVPKTPANKNAFASVPSTPTTLHGAFTNTVASDQTGTISENLNFDVKNDTALQKIFEGYINPNFTKLTIDSLFPSTGTTGYVRTNILPTPTTADKGKWFTFSLPHGTTVLQSQQTAINDLDITKDEQSALITLINNNTVDNGIVRRNNVPLAWYTTTVTGAVLKEAEDNSHIPASIRDWLKSYLGNGSNSETVLMNWYLTPEHPRLSEMDATIKVHNGSGDSTYVIGSHLVYGGDVAMQSIPKKEQTWEGVTAYYQALVAVGANVADTGILEPAFYQQVLAYLQDGGGVAADGLPPADAGLLSQ